MHEITGREFDEFSIRFGLVFRCLIMKFEYPFILPGGEQYKIENL